MSLGTHGVNAITVGNTDLLLTSSGGGAAVHLSASADLAGPHQAAVPDYFFEDSRAARVPALANYDWDALRAARWSPTTLCGRPWAVMIGGDGGSLSLYGEEPAYAPTCRRCLSLMDRRFPPPPPHPQLALVARVVTDTVAGYGYAEIQDVPGDQQTELRRRIRSLVRATTGHPCQTLVHDNILFVICEPLHAKHAAAHQAAFAAALDHLFTGEPPPVRPDPEWRLYWSTWATS